MQNAREDEEVQAGDPTEGEHGSFWNNLCFPSMSICCFQKEQENIMVMSVDVGVRLPEFQS